MPEPTRLSEAVRTGRTPGPALIAYTVAGDPDRDRSLAVLRTLAASGVDVLEVGVPFSDPVADGPVIEAASWRALQNGTTLSTTLDTIEALRRDVRTPVVLFTYANPVLRMGERRFAERAAGAGVDGVLVLDLPLEEGASLRRELDGNGLDTIVLVSPTSSSERMTRAVRVGRGFVYAISRLGVTGARRELAPDVRALVGRIRSATSLPIAVGFGISTPQHVAEVGRWADAAVVGSAIVERLAEWRDEPDVQDRLGRFVRSLRSAATPWERAGEA